MTMYPINLEYSHRDGVMHDGFAADEAAAIAAAQASMGADWRVTGAELKTRDIGAMSKTRAAFEEAWSAEIAAGWVTCEPSYGGYLGQAEFWAITAEAVTGEDE